MGVKVPGTKYSFWCECDIRGTIRTKWEKYGEKYSGVNAANMATQSGETCFDVTICIANNNNVMVFGD